METYSRLKKDLLQSLQAIKSTFVQAESIPGLSLRPFSVWETSCETIRTQLSGETIRVAVVGSIKSGKSTFVNSLIGADHLKRGAGVVTSFVTKLRSGPSLRARLIFKSWDDVNADMAQALVLLPEFKLSDENTSFDIRRIEDRDRLVKSLALLEPDQLVIDGTRNTNSLLLGAYLQGYERVREILSSEDLTLIYGPERFTEHRSFVGNDALSVYLKDIQLEIDSPILGDYVEIADCQGSDSPNPLHLAMIQDYLHLTHLIVYVISSRTGLRQADIKFLSLIKKMGILDNMLFVVNCDFNEHENRNDLENLVEKVREELSYIKPDSEVFTLSALLNLFRSENENLGHKDSNRLQQWEQDQSLKALSDSQTQAFADAFNEKVNRERYALLLENQSERIRILVGEIAQWIDVNREVLKQDADQIKAIVERLKEHQRRLGQIRSMVNQTLDGALNQIKSALKGEVDRLFNDRSEGVLQQVNDFINNFDLNTTAHEAHLKEVGFTQTLYLIFQEFKQALNMHLAETVTPKVLRFIRGQEASIVNQLRAAFEPYDHVVRDALDEFARALSQIGIGQPDDSANALEIPSLDSIKSIAGLKLPPAATTMRYSARIKTEAVLRLGFYTVLELVRALLKKPGQSEIEKQMAALRDGGKRMKRETLESIRYHFRDYQENIKFQYAFHFADAVANAMKAALSNRFETYGEDMLRMAEEVGSQKLDTAHAKEVLNEMAQAARSIQDRVRGVHDRLATMKTADSLSSDTGIES